jgi:predicted MFS family arabinose efflux permease
VRILLLAHWIPPALLCGAEALIVPYAAERRFPLGTAGWLMAALPVGMIFGNVVFGRLVRPACRERLVPVLVLAMGLPCLAFLAGLPWPLLAGALVVVGAGFVYSLGVQRQFRDAVPLDRRGQAFSLLSTGLMTAQGVCPAVAGLAAEVVPIAVVIATLGSLTVLTAAALRLVLPTLPPTPATSTLVRSTGPR